MGGRAVLVGVIAAVTLATATAASAVPGNGQNALLIFNDCDSGVGEVTLMSQASAAGRFATAHVVGTNRPAPLISLRYEAYSGTELVDEGGFAHANTQKGQPVVHCTGTFMIGDLRFEIEVAGFFPAGP